MKSRLLVGLGLMCANVSWGFAIGCSSVAVHRGDSAGGEGNTNGRAGAAGSPKGGSASSETKWLGGAAGQSARPGGGAAGFYSTSGAAGAMTQGGQGTSENTGGVAGGSQLNAGGSSSVGGTSGSMGIGSAGGVTVVSSNAGGMLGSAGVAGDAWVELGIAGNGGIAGGGAGGGGVAGGQAGNGVAGSSAASARPCSMHSDCEDLSPHPHSCSAKCAAGTCVVAVDPINMQSANNVTGGVDSPITSVWNSGTPYLVFMPPKNVSQDGRIVVKIQQLRDDNLPNGVAATYEPVAGLHSVGQISATLRNGKLGLLWHGQRDVGSSTPDYVFEFAESTLMGTAATSKTLSSSTAGTNRPESASQVFLGATGTTDYAMLKFSGTPRSWKGYAGDPAVASVSSSPLGNSPVDVEPSIGMLGETIFATGRNCDYMNGACPKHLVLQRYSASNLTALGTNNQLSAVEITDAHVFSPALGILGESVGLFWNEYVNGEARRLVRCVLAPNGSFLIHPVTTNAELIPKAVAGYAGGGGTLYAARPTSGTYFELVAQRFDGNLSLIGQPIVVSNSMEGEPTDVEAHVDASRQKTILTFRHGGVARYNLIHTGLCQ